MTDPLSKFISSFKYKADGFDTWRVISKQPYEGDCDDFSLTIAYLKAGNWFRFWFMVWTLQIRFLLVTAPSKEPHVVLRYKGKYIDNIKPFWCDTLDYPTRFPWVFLPPVVMIKVILGKVFK